MVKLDKAQDNKVSDSEKKAAGSAGQFSAYAPVTLMKTLWR